MKRWYYLFLLCVLTGCLSPIVEEAEEAAGVRRSVNVLPRSTAPIQYPLTLYAFDADKGTLVASKIQQAEDDELSLQLPTGNYYMVALAGASGCKVPSKPTLSSVIALPSCGYFSSSLQMGSIELDVLYNTTMSIPLRNQMAAVSFSLWDFPEEATSATAHLYPVASGISFNGEYAPSTTIEVPLEKKGDEWISPQFYSLPSELPASLTAYASTPDMSYGYGHSLFQTLEPDSFYAFSGSVKVGIMTNGAWPFDGGDINIPIKDYNPDNDNAEDDDNMFVVEALPEVGTLWNDYFVVSYADDEASNRMLLLSTTEWHGITSAAHEETPTMASDIASTYTEGVLDGWRIPTRDEVRKMCAASGNMSLDATNAYLISNGIAHLGTGNDAETGDGIRYLCDEASYSFRWDSEGKPSAVGSKRTYHLRRVRTVEFVVK